MQQVRPKKFLGQHFLADAAIAERIVDSLSFDGYKRVIEIGPGMGVLTSLLAARAEEKLTVIEIDKESVAYLKAHFAESKVNVVEEDFLQMDLLPLLDSPVAVIGNFPYNISTQIVFRVYDNRDSIVEVVGMFQKEVAQRICAAPGSRVYGIQSVLMQSCYDCEYLFTVEPKVFIPPPKVQSGVIRLKLNRTKKTISSEADFRKVIKTAFNQRRKTLRNALRGLLQPTHQADAIPFKEKRAEELSWQQFDELTQWVVGRGLLE